MAYIKIEQIQECADGLKNWRAIGESPAKECLIIQFKEGSGDLVVDDEMVNKVLYLQSRNGNVCVEFDQAGLIKSIEIS